MENIAHHHLKEWLQESDGEDEGEVLGYEDDDICKVEITVSDSEIEEYKEIKANPSDDEESDEDDSKLVISDQDLITSKSGFYTAKSGMKWSKVPFNGSDKSKSPNINIQSCGPAGAARECKAPNSCFGLYINEEIISTITECTNIHLNKIRTNYARERDCKITDDIEIKALIGILIMMGVNKCGRTMSEYWDNKFGDAVESIYLTMSESRFMFLINRLQFDDENTRAKRREVDKLAPIRNIVEIFVSNCQKYYTPSENLILNQQLVPFRGGCPFRAFISNRPDKIGLKIFTLLDEQFPYTCNLEVYCGIQPPGPYQVPNKAPDIVNKILKPVEGMTCNITMDSWFSSIPLFLELEKKNISCVGALKSNSPEVPQSFRTTKGRPVTDSVFGFQEKCTLVSYVPHRNRIELVASTKHRDYAINSETGDAKKPEIVTDFERGKYTVEFFEKLCKQYTVARKSRRWPMALFLYIIDIAGLNAFIIDSMVSDRKTRRQFLCSVAFDLMQPQLKRRVTQSLSKQMKMKGMIFLNIENEAVHEIGPPKKKSKTSRCYDCGRTRDRSTRIFCDTCDKPVCTDHRYSLCPRCYCQILENQGESSTT